jgi:hypothetical protein
MSARPEQLASLEKVLTADYACDEDQFWAFVAECGRLRREMGDAAFWAAVDAMLAEPSPAVTR